MTISHPSLPASAVRPQTDSGVILIALLWILTALSVIALSFSREGFVEVAAARNAQSLEKAYYTARAGIEETIYQLAMRRQSSTARRAELEDTPDPLDLGRATGSFGDGDYRVDIQDESGKISLNTASEAQLRSLAEAVGIEKTDAEVIADSILDWRDADSTPRPNGAEDDFYQSLPAPYRATNRRMNVIEELLLVRGVTPERFHGRRERASDGSAVYKYGLSRYLTPYSDRTQINVNFAPLPVLLSIPGMSPEGARAIYERRRVKPFKTTEEIARELPAIFGTATMSRLTVATTGVYMLTASAHVKTSRAHRTIRAVISLEPGSSSVNAAARGAYRTLYWNENIPDYEGTMP